MSVTARLVFDPTDADSIAASHSVGAFVRAGTDGDLIGSQTLNSLEWLNTAGPITDSAGNEVAVTSNALDVNIASGSIVIGSDKAEDSAHSSGDVGSYSLSVREDTLATSTDADGDYQSMKSNSLGALYVDASQFDINANMQAGDGTDITQTGGALDVNIASGDLDDNLANVAINNTATAVSTSAVNVVTTALAGRKWLYVANEGNKSLYFGETGVTTANGFPLHPGQQSEFRIGASIAPQVIGGAGASSEDMRVMELS